MNGKDGGSRQVAVEVLAVVVVQAGLVGAAESNFEDDSATYSVLQAQTENEYAT